MGFYLCFLGFVFDLFRCSSSSSCPWEFKFHKGNFLSVCRRGLQTGEWDNVATRHRLCVSATDSYPSEPSHANHVVSSLVQAGHLVDTQFKRSTKCVLCKISLFLYLTVAIVYLRYFAHTLKIVYTLYLSVSLIA